MKTKTSFSFCASRSPGSIHTKFLKVVIVCILLYSMTPVYAGTPWLHVEGNQIKDPVGNVVVLRGVSLIDLGFIDDWQGGSFAMIDRLTDGNDPQGSFAGWYTKVVRIPIVPTDAETSWPNRFNPANDHFYYGLLRPIVDYCAKKGIYVIIDWHYVADTWGKVPQTSEFWEHIAPKFANDSHVLFELFNEPINFVGTEEENWLSVRNDMQTWVDIVRTYAPRNLILVAGPCWSQMIGPIAANPVDGNNIVYVSHIYPGHWRHPWWYINHITTCAAAHPVMMTEWGFSQSNDPDPGGFLNGTITDYGQPLMDFIEGLGIGNTAWVASYDWGPPMFLPQPWPPPVGTWDLRCGEGEMGCFVKDTLYARRNDNQPCDTTEVNINVSPLSHDFGEVELGQPRNLTVSISNTGCGELTVSGVSIEMDFAITSFPPSSVVIKPNETLDMEVTYTPTILGNNSAVLKINSNDADEPVVEVQLSGIGIESPSEQIANILAFFDEAVEQGTLQGTSYECDKRIPHTDFQLQLLRGLIQAASHSIEHERHQQACRQLRHIYQCCDGQQNPPDLVTGDAVPKLASMVQQLMQTLGCR